MTDMGFMNRWDKIPKSPKSAFHACIYDCSEKQFMVSPLAVVPRIKVEGTWDEEGPFLVSKPMTGPNVLGKVVVCRRDMSVALVIHDGRFIEYGEALYFPLSAVTAGDGSAVDDDAWPGVG